VHGFPIIGGHHFDCVPGTAIQKRAIWSLADAFLAANAQIRINFDPSEWRMIFVGHPEHAGFNGTVLNASRRSRTSRAAVGCNRKYSRPLLARRLAIALRHRPMFFYDIEQSFGPFLSFVWDKFLKSTLT
jgi:hypothetical protein